MSKIIKICMLSILFVLLTTFLIHSTAEAGLKDRAFATHNVGKVGFFTTNIGQFYPYGGQFEKTLEYPINSGHICMYRQCIMVGVPINVVSAADGRFEEFDAVGGYNAGQAEIAMSDNEATWPDWGWPVQDTEGNPVIRSQQDSYCVYSDSTNWRYYNNDEADKLLDMRVHQSIYTWGVPGADKFIVLNFEFENTSDRPYEDFYFNFYSDLDIGGISNDAREWADDCIEFDKDRELVYFYDSDEYSDDWGEANPFLAGITFLETPNDMGITDWHWIDVTIDEVAVNSAYWDSVSYNLMRSDTSYFHEHPDLKVSDYFHLGDNPIDGAHYDDPNTTRIEDDDGNLLGGAMVAYICNGPVTIQPQESVSYMVGLIVADTKDEMIEINEQLWSYYYDDFNIATVPSPSIVAEASDRAVTINWDNRLDVEYINPINNTNDLEGYLIYRTTDQTLTNWTVLDTIPMQFKDDSLVVDKAYEYTDNAVFNGFNYFYNISAYRMGLTGNLEESIRLSDLNNIENQENAIAIVPMTKPATTKDDIDAIKVVPNPYVVSASWDEARIGNSPFGEPIRNLAFTHLPSPCTIRIYTVDGDLVKTIDHHDNSGREEWNLLTSENRPVVSGIYFYHVDSEIGEKLGRFAIIR